MTRSVVRRFSDPRNLLLLSLIVGTAWLRLRQLGYTEMWGDQALTLNAALEWVHGGALPLASMKSSFGVFNPPLVQYLYALPLFFSTNLLGVVVLVALVNLGGAVALAGAAARVVGWRAAAWALLLLAVNPWAVYYGRLIWMQSFVPGFAALTLAAVLLYFGDRPSWGAALGAGLALAATIQVHLTAIVLLPVLLAVALVFRRRVRLAHLLGAAAVFAVTWLPFLLFEIRNHWVDWQGLRAGLGQPAQVSAAAWLLLLDLLHGHGALDTLKLPADQWAAYEGPLPLAALVAGLLVMGIGVPGLALLRQWRARPATPGTPSDWPAPLRADLILVLWTVAPLLFYVRHNQYLQNYYLLYVLPAPLLLLARLADRAYLWLKGRLAARRPGARWAPWLAALAFLPLAVIALQQLRTDLLGQHRLAAGEVGQQRVVDVQRAITQARALLAARPGCQLVVMSNGAQYESSRFALLREFTRATVAEPSPARFVAAADGRLMPAPCALYFVSEADPGALDWLARTATPLPAATVSTPSETWQFFDLPATARAAAVAQLPAGAPLGTWDNGLALRQATVSGDLAPNGQLAVTLVWAVEQPAPPRSLHFGVYVLDAELGLHGQADGPGVDSTEWRVGDLFETTFAVPLAAELPRGEYSVAAALYFYPEIERLPLAGGAGDLLFLAQLSY